MVYINGTYFIKYALNKYGLCETYLSNQFLFKILIQYSTSLFLAVNFPMQFYKTCSDSVWVPVILNPLGLLMYISFSTGAWSIYLMYQFFAATSVMRIQIEVHEATGAYVCL